MHFIPENIWNCDYCDHTRRIMFLWQYDRITEVNKLTLWRVNVSHWNAYHNIKITYGALGTDAYSGWKCLYLWVVCRNYFTVWYRNETNTLSITFCVIHLFFLLTNR